MTNKISKAREAYELLWPNIENEMRGAEGSEAEEMERLWTLIGNALHDYGELLTTLSTIDAERLGEALQWATDTDLKGNTVIPDERYNTIEQAAATLHGLVRGE